MPKFTVFYATLAYYEEPAVQRSVDCDLSDYLDMIIWDRPGELTVGEWAKTAALGESVEISEAFIVRSE